MILVVATLFLAHAFYLACVAEDAFITFHFARHLAAGDGLVWNVGEPPVEGYTNFLWLLISALLLLWELDLPTASQSLGFTAGLITLIGLYRCGLLIGLKRRMAALPCVALACSGPFATWAGSGMETNLFAMWITLAVFHYSRFYAGSHVSNRGLPRDLYSSFALLLAATLTRPEGALIAGILLLYSIYSWRSNAEAGKRSISALRVVAGPASLYGLALLAYTVWRLSYFHYPLPNTFYAKTGGGYSQFVRGLEYCGLFALHYLTPWLAAVALAIAARSSGERPDRAPAIHIISLWTLFFYTTYIAAVGGDYMAMYRFFVPVLPLLYLELGLVIDRGRKRFGDSKGGMTLVAVSVLIALFGTLFHSTPYESEWVAEPERMHGNFRGVETERWYVARHRLIGEFFERYGREGESLATGAVGAVAYYSNLDVYDVHGIVDSHIAHHGKSLEELGTGLPGHEKTDYLYIFDKKPTFYMFSRRLSAKPLRGIPHLVDDVDAIVARDYRVGSVFLKDEANGESGYFGFLERRDRAQTVAR